MTHIQLEAVPLQPYKRLNLPETRPLSLHSALDQHLVELYLFGCIQTLTFGCCTLNKKEHCSTKF